MRILHVKYNYIFKNIAVNILQVFEIFVYIFNMNAAGECECDVTPCHLSEHWHICNNNKRAIQFDMMDHLCVERFSPLQTDFHTVSMTELQTGMFWKMAGSKHKLYK